MPSYRYLARDERGRAMSGTLEAATPEALADQLKQRGYLVTRTQEVRSAPRGGQAPAVLGWGRVGSEELALFNVQLATLIHVGIPLVTALRTLEAQTAHHRLRATIGRVATDVEGGRAFSEALATHPAVFSPLFISVIHAGEASGKLDDILTHLAEFHQRQVELRQQLATALTYPCLLLVFGIGIIGFLVTSIIPKFMDIFLDTGVPLPLPTLILHVISQALRHHWPWILGAAAAAGILIRQGLRSPAGRRRADAWLLGLPVAGSLCRYAVISRVARTLETLLSSGVPILQSLSIAAGTAGNVVMAEVVHAMEASARQGGTLAEPLKSSHAVPPMAAQMIAVGEASGTLDRMLQELADHYDQMVAYQLKRVMALVEPLFLVIMGGLVALIMASVLLPLFRLVNTIR